MALTIYTDSIGNKYLGYAGDINNIATGIEVRDNLINLITDFTGNTAQFNENRLGWRADGTAVSNISQTNFGNSHFSQCYTNDYPFSLNSKDLGNSDVHLSTLRNINELGSLDKAVAMSNGIDLGVFGWSLDSNNDVSNFQVWWTGEVKGNSNITAPQTRSGFISRGNPFSFGVEQADNSTQRIHLDTQAGASHNIDCAEETAKLYLIQDDGAGGDGGTVGYCENIFLTKSTGRITGQFVTLNNLGDNGSTHGVVVGQWGDNEIIMRVYDGVS